MEWRETGERNIVECVTCGCRVNRGSREQHAQGKRHRRARGGGKRRGNDHCTLCNRQVPPSDVCWSEHVDGRRHRGLAARSDAAGTSARRGQRERNAGKRTAAHSAAAAAAADVATRAAEVVERLERRVRELEARRAQEAAAPPPAPFGTLSPGNPFGVFGVRPPPAAPTAAPTTVATQPIKVKEEPIDVDAMFPAAVAPAAPPRPPPPDPLFPHDARGTVGMRDDLDHLPRYELLEMQRRIDIPTVQLPHVRAVFFRPMPGERFVSQDVRRVAECCPNLAAVHFRDSGVVAADLIDVAARCPHLEWLDCQSTAVDLVTLHRMAQALPRLKFVDVSGTPAGADVTASASTHIDGLFGPSVLVVAREA